MAMKVLYKYANQEGKVVIGTSHKVASDYINKDEATTTAVFAGEVAMSERALKDIRTGCDGEYEYVQRGIYKRRW